MPGGRSKITFDAEEQPTTSSAQATVTQPGRIPNAKAIVKGDGSHGNPYQGVFYSQQANYNAATISLALMRESGDYAWMRIKRVHIYHAGTIGVTIWLGSGMGPTDGTGTGDEMPIGRPITTTQTYDVLTWDFGPDGILLWRSANPYAATPFPAGSWTGELALEITGYAATDDLDIYVECEWAVRQ